MNPLTLLLLFPLVPMFAALVQRAVWMNVKFSRRSRIACTAACVLLGSVFAPVAMAAEPVFTSPKGFTITPPDGWVVASKDAASVASDVFKKKFPKFDGANLDRMAVMILNPSDIGGTNVNVVVSPGRMPIDDSGAEAKVANILREQYTKMGVSVGRATATRKTFGTHPAILADVESNIGGVKTRQWQAMMISGKQTLIVTCTSPQSTFDQYVPVFTKAIEGMTFPADAGAEFPLWLRYGIIGGAVGGLIGLFQKLMASRKKGAGAA